MARLLWLLPVGLLQACAGTPVAEQLERSFAVPEARPAQAAAPVPVVKDQPNSCQPIGCQPYCCDSLHAGGRGCFPA